MREISLTHGKVAIVDDQDFEWLYKFEWHAYCEFDIWYAKHTTSHINGKQYTIRMHRLIMGLESGDGKQVDHIDHDGLHNWRSNLRVVTHGQNQFNRRGTKGYYWNKDHKKFLARISLNNHKIILGEFDDPALAHQAYLNAKPLYHQFGSI